MVSSVVCLPRRPSPLLNMADTTVDAQAGMSVVVTEEGTLAPAQLVTPAPPARITKKVDYRRYLMGHHQSQPGASRPDHQ